MSLVRALRTMVLGETWVLPAGLLVVVAGTRAARPLLGDAWHRYGGFVLLAGVVAVLVASVAASLRR